MTADNITPTPLEELLSSTSSSTHSLQSLQNEGVYSGRLLEGIILWQPAKAMIFFSFLFAIEIFILFAGRFLHSLQHCSCLYPTEFPV